MNDKKLRKRQTTLLEYFDTLSTEEEDESEEYEHVWQMRGRQMRSSRPEE